MSAIIEFRDVSLAIAPGRLLLDHISLALEEGTTTAILGRSGSGKTTLLRTINRLLKTTNGEILMRGTNLGKLRSHRRKAFHGLRYSRGRIVSALHC